MISWRDDKGRMCFDYRDVKKAMKKDAYLIPNMDAILDRLRNARYILKVDLRQAYYQVPLEHSSRKYTAFVLPDSGLWQFTRMPFGLANAPATFQRLIDALFRPECEPYVFCYLDDIIVVTETFDEHLKWLEIVLSRIADAGLVVHRKKCEFGCASVTYLGYLLDRDGLRPDSERIAPVLNYPTPRNVSDVRQFLGMTGWYARFIQNYVEMKLPINKLTFKGQKWEWGEEQDTAFKGIKSALTRAPVLARPDFTKPFIIQCDASNSAIGALFAQIFEDGEHPIIYASRTLTPAERNYSTTEKECLALLWAIKKFRPYVEGYRFTAITDHSALKWLRNLKEPSGRLARWALEMQQWDFEVEHRKGRLHQFPDALSRMYDQVEVEAAVFDEVRDPWYLRMLSEVQAAPLKYKDWIVEEGKLYKYREDPLLGEIIDGEEKLK